MFYVYLSSRSELIFLFLNTSVIVCLFPCSIICSIHKRSRNTEYDCLVNNIRVGLLVMAKKCLTEIVLNGSCWNSFQKC